MSEVAVSTNTMSASGATPGTFVPLPLPAAMSITCVPCAGSLGSGPYPSASYGSAWPIAASIFAGVKTRP
jgi:hypothetical protein